MKRRTLLVWSLLGATAACARVPRSGPVVEVSQSAVAQASQGVDIAPQKPRYGDAPEAILAGFLTAMASHHADYAVARSYLTSEAAKRWQPASGVTVYDSTNHKPVTTDKAAALQAPLVGVLDAQGRFTAKAGTFAHDFKMTKENGQWRIAAPPQGLLLARYLFDRYYTPVTLWFLAPDPATCVPEVVYLPDGTVSASTVLTALFTGPSPWGRPVIGTALPPELKDPNSSVQVETGRPAQVALSPAAMALNDEARQRAVAQIVLTLTELPGVDRVRISVNGTPWQVGANSSDELRRSDVASFLALDVRAPAETFVVLDKVVGRLTERNEFAPLPGVFGRRGWGGEPGAFDVSRDHTQVVVVDHRRETLWIAGAEGGRPVERYRGAGLVRPQYALDGSVWAIAHPEGTPVVVRVALDGTVQQLALADLPAGTRVMAFRVSPDQSRLALVVRQGKTTTVGMMRVLHDRVDGWRPMPAAAGTGVLTDPSDVAWAEEFTMVVVAATTGDPRRSVYRVSADGARVESLGPGSLSAEVVSVVAQPRSDGTTALIMSDDGQVFRFEDRFRWAPVASKVTAVALPS